MKITDVYQQLKACHLCKSGYQFSREYLGRTDSYYGVLKLKNTEPSVQVLLTLYYSLHKRIDALSGGNNPVLLHARLHLKMMAVEVERELQAKCQLN